MLDMNALLRNGWTGGRKMSDVLAEDGAMLPKHLFPWAVTLGEQAFHQEKSLADLITEKAREHGLEPGSVISSAPHEDVVVVYPPNWKGADWSWARDKLWREMEEEMRKPPPLTQDELRDDPC